MTIWTCAAFSYISSPDTHVFWGNNEQISQFFCTFPSANAGFDSLTAGFSMPKFIPFFDVLFRKLTSPTIKRIQTFNGFAFFCFWLIYPRKFRFGHFSPVGSVGIQRGSYDVGLFPGHHDPAYRGAQRGPAKGYIRKQVDGWLKRGRFGCFFGGKKRLRFDLDVDYVDYVDSFL